MQRFPQGKVTFEHKFAYSGTESAKPGVDGVSIVDGHASGIYKPGVFTDLAKLKIGDKFLTEFGDRSVKNFEIMNINSHTPEETSKKMFEREMDID